VTATGVVREIAAQVLVPSLRITTRPRASHADWLINYLASISKRVALATSSLGTFQIGFIDERIRAIFGRSYAAEPQVLIEQLRQDEAITEADPLILTVPNQLGVAYDAHMIEAILTHVAPALGWR
jgi:hypothetical protein